MDALVVVPISKAAANQRKGRAGRTGVRGEGLAIRIRIRIRIAFVVLDFGFGF
jgi:HrpA-like RNA helicase